MGLGHVTFTSELLYEEHSDLVQLTCRVPARTLSPVFDPVWYLHWAVLMSVSAKLRLHTVRREG